MIAVGHSNLSCIIYVNKKYIIRKEYLFAHVIKDTGTKADVLDFILGTKFIYMNSSGYSFEKREDMEKYLIVDWVTEKKYNNYLKERYINNRFKKYDLLGRANYMMIYS